MVSLINGHLLKIMQHLIKRERQYINHSDYIHRKLSSNYNLTPFLPAVTLIEMSSATL
ncbi:Hypothetical protein LOCK908_0379 [Lacticaseibacillus rhamnosus LOCK908]|nr:conserved hypothetical protein [Lacticaseibacillus rhamnosus ATCC 8530]AGP73063.1 Hypothetical protein LOCK908_0379 [Lacticaseibacillus rhamnosus LOCK908]CAR89212.1 Putative protein without homology [Lacticaseibacillus rhamnosus Lc 705]